MLAHSHGQRLVVESMLLFHCAWKWIVRDNSRTNPRHVEVNVFQVLDLVVQRCLACHPVYGQRPTVDRNRNCLWRLLFRGMQLLPVLVVSKVVLRLHHWLALCVEERVSLLVALLPDRRVEHQLAVGILPLLSFLVEHGRRRQLHQRRWPGVFLLPFLTLLNRCRGCGRL